MQRRGVAALLLHATLREASVEAVDPVDPGPLPSYAVDQCDNPIALVTAAMTLPVNGAKNWHSTDTQNDWLGQCVTAQWEDWNGRVNRINVTVGSTLPNPGICSSVAETFNGGPTPHAWDFSGSGWCGLGSCKNVVTDCTEDVRSTAPLQFGRLACLAHDACVWSRCQQDTLRPNAMVAFSDDDSTSVSWSEIKALFDSVVEGEPDAAEQRLKKGDPNCGKAIYDTATAYFDATNQRITDFENSNQKPTWWNRRRWSSNVQKVNGADEGLAV